MRRPLALLVRHSFKVAHYYEFRRQTDRTVCLLCNLDWTELTF